MPIFRKKQIAVEAVQVQYDPETDEGNANEVEAFLGDNLVAWDEESVDYRNTQHGSILRSHIGEWIVKGEGEGDFYPCDPDVFDRTYEPVA